MKSKGLERILQVGAYSFVALTLLFVFSVVKATNVDTNYTANLQKTIYNADQDVTNTRAYIKNNQLISEFLVIPKSSTVETQEEVEKNKFESVTERASRLISKELPDIETPIYYQAGISNEEVGTQSSGTQSTKYNSDNIKVLSEGFIKQGANELFDISELEKSKVYYIAIFPEGVDKKSVDTNTTPQLVITYDTSKIPEYLDMNDFVNSFEYIKNNEEQRKLYSKWIYFNELNPNIISSFFSDDTLKFRPAYKQYASKASEENCLDYIDNIIKEDTKLIQEQKVNGWITRSSQNFVTVCYQYKKHPEISKINVFYTGIQSNIAAQEQIATWKISNNSVYATRLNPEGYNKYRERVNELNVYEKALYIQMLIAEKENYSNGSECQNTSPYCKLKPEDNPANSKKKK